MNIVVLKTSTTPLYKQIYDQILTQILKRELKPNECLPSIRQVARELNISVISVKGAYDALEQDGYIYTLPAKGCFVAELFSPEDIHNGLIKEAATWVRDFCKNYHITVSEVIERLKEESLNK